MIVIEGAKNIFSLHLSDRTQGKQRMKKNVVMFIDRILRMTGKRLRTKKSNVGDVNLSKLSAFLCY